MSILGGEVDPKNGVECGTVHYIQVIYRFHNISYNSDWLYIYIYPTYHCVYMRGTEGSVPLLREGP